MVELPGHGSSPALPKQAPYYAASADALDALRQELGIHQWDVMGYSVGAWVVQAYGERYPEHIVHLIILCPAVLTLPGWASLRNLIWLDTHAPLVGNWLLSGWRLHTLVCLLGFGRQNHPYARQWTQEIGGQPMSLIKQLLIEMPGAGRAEFRLPDRPVLFIWAKQDAISARPHQMGPYDRVIPGHHSAPMLYAQAIAEEVLAFARN
jgi:pimeloyl-ACP methyl ester carboxylesterase